MKVVFTQRAVASLERVGDHIAQDNPIRALSLVRELRARADELALHPRAFPLVPRYERHGIRRRAWRSYVIFYQVEPQRVLILLITHGAQDLDQLLLPDGPA